MWSEAKLPCSAVPLVARHVAIGCRAAGQHSALVVFRKVVGGGGLVAVVAVVAVLVVVCGVVWR